MMARKAGYAIVAGLLALAACKQGTAPIRKLDAIPGYKLHIVFHGLIAYVSDSGKLWAMLVNAGYDPAQVTADDLPPGMFQEMGAVPVALRAGWLHSHVPPHRPQVRFQNATVTGSFSGDPSMGRTIPGADLRFVTSQNTMSTPKLGQIANASLVVAARTDLAGQLDELAKLDQVDPPLLSPARVLDKRLAARALVEAGDITANLVTVCGKTLYSFKLPGEVGGCGGAPMPLAEEVVVEQTGLSGPVTIDLGTGEKIFVSPKDATQPVIIEVVNQTDDQIARAGVPDCNEDSRHVEAFRWFYRLVGASGQAATGKHYFPCVANGNFGPPICPNKQLTIGK